MQELTPQEHQKLYETLIMIAKARDWTRETAPGYVENHHILPKN